MKVLVLNCGSSSLKYCLFDVKKNNVILARGQVDRIGIDGGSIKQSAEGKETIEIKNNVADHIAAIDLVLKLLVDTRHNALVSLQDIGAVGHRIVHGGEHFSASVIIDDAVKKNVKDLIPLAPLHNPANLQGILALEKLLPGVPQVGVFDTAFHQTIPEKSFLFGIPYEFYKKYHIRRYGFHGSSHKYVAEKACESLGWDISTKKIITCHLGNGASIAAIENGKSVDTSMGFTPNHGLMMGTRSGALDMGIVQFLSQQEGLDLDEVIEMLNKKSGVLGVSNGFSSDMRDLSEAMEKENPDANRALSVYADRVKHYIGAYVAQLNGLDLIVMTGGIGENNWLVRELSLSGLEYLGISFDKKANKDARDDGRIISTDSSKAQAMIVHTNEELVIARETVRLLERW